jgi:hypothetical protein
MVDFGKAKRQFLYPDDENWENEHRTDRKKFSSELRGRERCWFGREKVI